MTLSYIDLCIATMYAEILFQSFYTASHKSDTHKHIV